MRHVRILGLCLLAVFAIGAIASTTALAHEPGQLTGEWKVLKGCPYNNPEVIAAWEKERGGVTCFAGVTAGGLGGGHFSLGRILVPLNKKITLQGAAIFHENESNISVGRVIPPENGEPALVAPELAVPYGIKLINELMRREWPEALKTSFNEAVKNKEAGLKVKIEVAGGNRLFEEPEGISTENLIEGNGTAFELPLKVRLISPWLAKLGGGACTIGTDENPVVQHLTTGQSGGLHGETGNLHFNRGFTLITLSNDTLVDGTWGIETPVTECGGAYEEYIDRDLNKLLNIPTGANAGQTILTGTTYAGGVGAVKHEAETGKER